MRIFIIIIVISLTALANAQEKSTKYDPTSQSTQDNVKGGKVYTTRTPVTNRGDQTIVHSVEVYKELPSGAFDLSKDVEQGLVGGFSPVAPELATILAFPGGIGPTFPGGGLSAWGCWKSTCCAEWGRCCLPRYPSGFNCWTCCRRTEECTRCIWPW